MKKPWGWEGVILLNSSSKDIFPITLKITPGNRYYSPIFTDKETRGVEVNNLTKTM